MKLLSLVTVALLLLLTACEPAAENSAAGTPEAGGLAEAEPNVIDTVGTFIPGKSLGNITVGENSVSAFEGLDSLAFNKSATGYAVNSYVIDDNGRTASLDVFTTLDSNSMNTQRATIIRTTAAKYKDEQGLGVGSSLEEIQAAYEVAPVASFTESGSSRTIYGGKEGVFFEFSGQTPCRAVVISAAGEESAELYRVLFDTYAPISQK